MSTEPNYFASLTTVPASDGNFKSALDNATLEELTDAMEANGKAQSKGRFQACIREIKARYKESGFDFSDLPKFESFAPEVLAAQETERIKVRDYQRKRLMKGILPHDAVLRGAEWTLDQYQAAMKEWRAEESSKTEEISGGVAQLADAQQVGAPNAGPQEHEGSTPSSPTELSPPKPDLVIIGCGKAKGDSPVAAKDLYTGTLFRSRRAYAEAAGCPWLIVSAKHGLVTPNTELSPYDVTIEDLSDAEQSDFQRNVINTLIALFGSEDEIEGKTIELHAGNDYVDLIEEVIEDYMPNLVLPMESLSIGEQMGWYKRHGFLLDPEQLSPPPGGAQSGLKSDPPSAAPVSLSTGIPVTLAMLDKLPAEKPAEAGQDALMGQQLTEQFVRATGAIKEQLVFGSMMLTLEEHIDSTRGIDRTEKGHKFEKGTGTKAWLKQHAPNVPHSSACRFRDLAEVVRKELKIGDKATLEWLLTTPAEQITDERQIKQRGKVMAFIEGKSQKQLLLGLGGKEDGRATNKGGFRPNALILRAWLEQEFPERPEYVENANCFSELPEDVQARFKAEGQRYEERLTVEQRKELEDAHAAREWNATGHRTLNEALDHGLYERGTDEELEQWKAALKDSLARVNEQIRLRAERPKSAKALTKHSNPTK